MVTCYPFLIITHERILCNQSCRKNCNTDFTAKPWYTALIIIQAARLKAGDPMTGIEMMQKNIEEFAWIQKYMILTSDKESAAYKEM